MNTAVIEFLTNNPNSNKGQIADGINLRGLGLFNLLKKMMNEGEIQVEGEGHDATYTIVAAETISDKPTVEETVVAALTEKTTEDGGIEETVIEQTEQIAAQPSETEIKPAKKQAGRNTGTYLFNGTSYNKGKLINAIVAAYVAKNKNTTHDKLKEVFPDTLLKRFGIFQTVEKAREISGTKYDRYFFKEEFQIKLKDCIIVTCNQITGENILPFLKQCAEVNLLVEVEYA